MSDVNVVDEAELIDEDLLDDDDTTLLGGKRVVTVAQLSTLLNIRPQVVNMWVAKQGCPTVQEKPRMLNVDDVLAWKGELDKTRATTPRQPREKAQRVKQDGTLAGPDEEGTPETRALEKLKLTPKDRNLMAWNRGEGRGWSLGKPLDASQPVVDDYITLVNHAGKVSHSAGARLLQEAKEGKLFIIDVDLAIAFLTGQLEGVINTVAQPHEELIDARDSMKEALDHILSWKKATEVTS